jgi:hypothetical protein
MKYMKLVSPTKTRVVTQTWDLGTSIDLNPGKELLIQEDFFNKYHKGRVQSFIEVTPVETEDWYIYAGTAFDEYNATHRVKYTPQPLGHNPGTGFFPDFTNRFSVPHGFHVGALFDIIGVGVIMGTLVKTGDKVRALVSGARKDQPTDWEFILDPANHGSTGTGSSAGHLDPDKTLNDLDADNDGKIDSSFLPAGNANTLDPNNTLGNLDTDGDGKIDVNKLPDNIVNDNGWEAEGW